MDVANIDPNLLDSECIYFCGHSLGLQPKKTKNHIEGVLQKWGEMGVHGHFEGSQAWNMSESLNKPTMAMLTGAKVEEIGIMNFLSLNLHLLLVSFYRPNQTRHKILIEEHAFPSDYVNNIFIFSLASYNIIKNKVFLKAYS